MRTFRIAMVQMNPTVGDLDGNVRRIIGWLREAKKAKPDLVAFPELVVTGYPPEDLLLKPQFVADNRRALNEVIRACRDCVAVVGYVFYLHDRSLHARFDALDKRVDELRKRMAVDY